MDASRAAQIKQHQDADKERKIRSKWIEALTSGRTSQLEVLIPQLPVLRLEDFHLLLDSSPSCGLRILDALHSFIPLSDELAYGPQPGKDPPEEIILHVEEFYHLLNRRKTKQGD